MPASQMGSETHNFPASHIEDETHFTVASQSKNENHNYLADYLAIPYLIKKTYKKKTKSN